MTVREVASPLQRRLLFAAPFARRGHGRSLEALLFVLIVVAVLGTAFEGLSPALKKLRALEAISLASTQRGEAMTIMALTGRLTDDAIPADGRHSRWFDAPRWRDGELVLPASAPLRDLLARGEDEPPASDAAVAFRAARSAAGTTIWLCGDEAPPSGFAAAPMRHTTIAARHLPYFCR
jgi:hypothetical protein